MPVNKDDSNLSKERILLEKKLLDVSNKINISVGERDSLIQSIRTGSQYVLSAFRKLLFASSDINDTTQKLASSFTDILDVTNELNDTSVDINSNFQDWLGTLQKTGKLTVDDHRKLSNAATKLSTITQTVNDSYYDVSENLDSITDNLDLTTSLLDTASKSANTLGVNIGMSLDDLNELSSAAKSIEFNIQPGVIDVGDISKNINESTTNLLDTDLFNTNLGDITSQINPAFEQIKKIHNDIADITDNITQSAFQLSSIDSNRALNLNEINDVLQTEIDLQDQVLSKLQNKTANIKEQINLNSTRLGLDETELTNINELLDLTAIELNLQRQALHMESQRMNVISKYGGLYKGLISGASNLNQEISYGIERFLYNLPGGTALVRALGIHEIASSIDEQLNKSFSDFIKNVNAGKGVFRSMGSSIFSLGKNIIAALGPVGIILGLIVSIGAVFTAINNKAKDLSNQFGITRDRSWQLYQRIVDIQTSLSNQLSTYEDIALAMNTMIHSTGILVFDTDKVITKVADLGKHIGYGVEVAANLHESFKKLGLNSDVAANFQLITAKMAEAEGLSSHMIGKDILDNSTRLYELFYGMPKQLVRSVIEIRKLGVSVEKAVQISDHLLDIEGSLTSEFEASAAIGRQLNLQKARQLAIEGDLAGMTKEVVNQIGSQEQLSKMSYMQRRLIAKALGLEVEDMGRILSAQTKIAKLPEDQRAAAAKYAQQMEHIEDMTDSQFRNELGRLQATERLEAQWDKIKNQLLVSLLPLAEAFSELLMDLAPLIEPLIGALKLVGKIVKFLKPLIDGLVLPFRFIGASIGTINEMFSDTVEVGTSFNALLSDTENKFSSIGSLILGGLGAIFTGNSLITKAGKFFGLFKGKSLDAAKSVTESMQTISGPKPGALKKIFSSLNPKNLFKRGAGKSVGTEFGMEVGESIVKSSMTSMDLKPLMGKLYSILGKFNPVGLFKGISKGLNIVDTKGILGKLSNVSGALKGLANFKFTGLSEKISNIVTSFKNIKLPNLSSITKKLIIPKFDISNMMNSISSLKDRFLSINKIKLLPNLNLSKMKSAIPNISKLFAKINFKLLPKIDLGSILKTAQTDLSSVTKFNIIPNFITISFTKFKSFITAGADNLISKLKFIPSFKLDNFKTFFTNITSKLPNIKKLFSFIPNIDTTIISKTLSAITGKVTNIYTSLAGKLSSMNMNIFSGMFTTLSSTLGKFKTSFLSFLGTSKSMGGNLFSSLLGKVSSMPKLFAAAFTFLPGLLGKMDGMKDIISGTVDSISTKLSSVTDILKGGLSSITETIGKKVSAVLPKTSSFIGGLIKKAGPDVAETGLKTVAKAGGKMAGKGLLKSVIKKIPILGAVAGAGFAIDRLIKGDYVGAGGELLSGIAGSFPGIGTAISTGIDIALVARDVAKDNSKSISNLENDSKLDVATPTSNNNIDNSNTEINNIPTPSYDLTEVNNSKEIFNSDRFRENYQPERDNFIGDLKPPVVNVELPKNNINVAPAVAPTLSKSVKTDVKQEDINTKNKLEKTNIQINTTNVEVLLKQLINLFSVYAARPVEVSIGDGGIRDINNRIRKLNGQ